VPTTFTTPTFAAPHGFLGVTRNDRSADFIVAGVLTLIEQQAVEIGHLLALGGERRRLRWPSDGRRWSIESPPIQ
jgi:hypothetical protein